jgi:hypothetical protein
LLAIESEGAVLACHNTDPTYTIAS